MLNGTCVMAVVGKLVTGRVAQHVGVGREAKLRMLASTGYDFTEGGVSNRATRLRQVIFDRARFSYDNSVILLIL